MRLKSRAETTLWFGRGFPIRELLHVDDLPGAIVFCLLYYDEYEHIFRGRL